MLNGSEEQIGAPLVKLALNSLRPPPEQKIERAHGTDGNAIWPISAGFHALTIKRRLIWVSLLICAMTLVDLMDSRAVRGRAISPLRAVDTAEIAPSHPPIHSRMVTPCS